MGLISTTQAHDYAVGFSLVDERGPAYARGFPVDFYDLRRDGLRTYSWSVREPAAIDRIQYLRGPAAVLYGDGSPGGLVNMVLKKPLPIRRHELSASGGSQGFGRLTADFTGPLTSSRRVRYRLVAASEWLDNGFDNDERRLTLLPTIAVDVGTRGTITFDTEFYDQRGRSYRHVVPATTAAQRGDFSEYPWDLNVNSPDDGWTGGNISPGLRLDLGLGQQTSLHVAARYTKIDGEIDAQALVRAGAGRPRGDALPVPRDQHLARVPVGLVCRHHSKYWSSRASTRRWRRGRTQHGGHRDRRRSGRVAGHFQSQCTTRSPNRCAGQPDTTCRGSASMPSIKSGSALMSS